MSAGLGPVEVPGVAGLSYGQVSVGSTATQIIAARTGRRAVLIVQHGTTDIFVGDSEVTSGTGVLLPGTKGASLSIPGNMAIYGITASGSQTVSFIEVF